MKSMTWIHLIALGAGVGIYAVGSLLFKVFTEKREATVLKLASEQEGKPKLKVVPHDAADREAISAPSNAKLRQPSEKSDERTVRTPLSVTPVTVEERFETELLATPPKVLAELEPLEAPQEKTEDEVELDAHEEQEEQAEADTSDEMLSEAAEIPDTLLSPPKHQGTKHWFLVKSSSGQVRVCQAWEATPKTIAGPFLTRDEATKAKTMAEAT